MKDYKYFKNNAPLGASVHACTHTRKHTHIHIYRVFGKSLGSSTVLIQVLDMLGVFALSGLSWELPHNLSNTANFATEING